MISRFSGSYLAALGLLIAMAGLGWDVWLHARDNVSLQTEDIFTLTNPGHVLFGAGLMITAAGVVLGLFQASVPSPRTGAWASAGAVAVAMASVFAFGFASAGESHTHGLTTVHDPAIEATLAKLSNRKDVEALVGTSHHPSQTGPLTLSMDEAAKLGTQIAQARKTAERFQSIEDAGREGYVEVTQDFPLLGAHFINAHYTVDTAFDIDKPEMLIYAYQDGVWRLYGLAFMSRPMGFDGETPPEGFAGPFDEWHWHDDLCLTAKGLRVATEDECLDGESIFLKRTGYILHVWLDNPAGLFAHYNPDLKGSDEYIKPNLP